MLGTAYAARDLRRVTHEMKRGDQIICIIVTCLMPLLALAETNIVVTTTNVLLHLKQINQHEGIYSVHVWKILETTNGVPELITQTHSDEPDVARLASNLLWQISAPMWEKSHSMTNDWNKWWQETGSKKPFKDLYRNFDSHYK